MRDEIDRVYSTAFFERVTYQLEPSNPGTQLTIRVKEKEDNQFRFGFRVDQRNKTSILLNTTLHNPISRRFATHSGIETGRTIFF